MDMVLLGVLGGAMQADKLFMMPCTHPRHASVLFFLEPFLAIFLQQIRNKNQGNTSKSSIRLINEIIIYSIKG
jgi:hypothetical protein